MTLFASLLLFVLMAGTVEAAPTFEAMGRNGQPARLVLHEDPCDPAVMIYIHPRIRAAFKRSTLTWGGKDWKSCWIEVEGIVYSIDEAGDVLRPIPKRFFNDEGV